MDCLANGGRGEVLVLGCNFGLQFFPIEAYSQLFQLLSVYWSHQPVGQDTAVLLVLMGKVRHRDFPLGSPVGVMPTLGMEARYPGPSPVPFLHKRKLSLLGLAHLSPPAFKHLLKKAPQKPSGLAAGCESK